MDAFEHELRLSFLDEAKQLLNEVEQCYLQLELNPNDNALIDQIFRVAHNIKGSARAVGFAEVGQFAHEFENLLLKIKKNELEASQTVVDLLLKCNDHLSQMVSTLKEDLNATFDSQNLVEKILEALSGQLTETSTTTEEEQSESVNFEEITNDLNAETDLTDSSVGINSDSSDSFDHLDHSVSLDGSVNPENSVNFNSSNSDNTDTIDSSFSQTITDGFNSDLSDNADDNVYQISQAQAQVHAPVPTAKTPAATPASAPQQKTQNPSGGNSDESIRVSLSRLEKLLDYVGELVILHAVLKEQTLSSNLLIRKTVHQLGKATKEVQDISMGLRMVPVKQTFLKMQRIVRDTSSDLGKKVNLILEGEETELDKTILERISDPLVHLVRNACDHGIESPEQRIISGKSETGTLKLSAFHQSGKLVIKISDDGAGIDPEILRRKAIEKKIISPTAQLTDKEAISLIFHPGFSTKAVVTDVSGRGVGMDVVKFNIESIQGEVLIDTEVGKGTTFKILLPLTLAIIDAMVVKLNDLRYVIPLSHIQESVKLEQKDVKKTTGLGEILLLRGDNIPLFHLTDLLIKKNTLKNENAHSIAVVIKSSQETFAVIVDDIIGQYQVVIKKLGSEIQELKGVAGSAILGDGKPALILELAELVNKNKKVFNSDLRGVAI